jgi:hypothetical protein
MRRSSLAGIGLAAVLIVAACSTDEPSQVPLAPTVPSLAQNVQCKNSLANTIETQQDTYFDETNEATLNGLLTTIKAECPMSVPSATVLTYLQRVVDFRGTVDVQRAKDLVSLWNNVTTYATGTPIGRNYTVLLPGTINPQAPGIRGGGAAILDNIAGPLEMYTFDGQAGIKISSNQTPSGPHFWTLDPSGCPVTTLRQATTDCYDVQAYPPAATWSPEFTVGMCVTHVSGPTALSHAEAGYGTEVLQEDPDDEFPWDLLHTCAQTHTFMDTWLGRKTGPLGRALALGLDYLRPQTLFANDAGETGISNDASPFGAVLTVVFDDNFDNENIGPFAPGTDPTVGDNASSWDIYAPSPGYVEIQDGSVLAPGGGLPGNVVVISQALGACKKNCPTFRLLGTRVNPSSTDTIGTYEITFSQLQNKPNIKEAPFVVLSNSGQELARLSYVSESNNNRIKYNGNVVGTWTQNVAKSIKIVVRLYDGDNSTPDWTTSLYLDGSTTATVLDAPFKTSGQKTFSTIGYRLDGIDAGIMAADNFLVVRLTDKP